MNGDVVALSAINHEETSVKECLFGKQQFNVATLVS